MKHPISHGRIILQTLLLCFLLIALTVAVTAASSLLGAQLLPEIYPDGIPAQQGQLRALTVRTRNNADFPSVAGLPAQSVKAELQELVDFAQTYGYNTIFFEAAPEADAFYRSSVLPASRYWTGEEGGFTFFDPLKYLVNICKEPGIQVYAVVNPFALPDDPQTSRIASGNPEWVMENGLLDPAADGVQKLIGKVCKELSEYDIAGIVFSGVDSDAFDDVTGYDSQLDAILSAARDALRDQQGQRLGMVVNGDALTAEDARDLATAPVQNGTLDFVVPSMGSGMPDIETFQAELAAWQSLCEQASDENHTVAYYPLHTAGDDTAYQHPVDNSYYFEQQAGADGIAISNYGSLNTEKRVAAYSIAATFAQQAPTQMPDLSYPQSFAICRPTETLTISSAWSSYFITGTSDPDQPLYYAGQEVERPGATGLWGVLVDVPYGTNTYTFSQGGATQSVTITRPQPSTEPTLISTLSKSSLYPSDPEVVLSGTQLKLSCTAPAGGTVTAQVGGLSATLEPVAAASQNGVAVTYQQTLDLSSLSKAGQVTKIGQVTYQLHYNGMTSTGQSAGEVYVAGEGARPILKTKTYMTPVSQNGADDGVYSTILKEGCVDYIAENAGSYYRISSGGYILKSAVEIPEGTVSADNTISSISLNDTGKGEQFVLTGTAYPTFFGKMEDGAVVITLKNTTGIGNINPSALNSRLCDTIDTAEGEDDGEPELTFTFHLRDGVSLLGWDVLFDGDNIILYLREKPVLQADTAKPLDGITIVLDPGHGGTDPGAAGVPYESGPWEKEFNLADAYALKSRLEAFGAQVAITQEDATMTLNDRMELAESLDADLFISCHHNSLSETVDSNDVSGIEVYYYNQQSETFAQDLGASLSEDTGRRLRFAQWSWYRVTMMTARPAVLIESAYLCSPIDYEDVASDYSMHLYANAVADAVLRLFQG